MLNVETFGEDTIDLLTLTRRPCYNLSYAATGVANQIFSFPLRGVAPSRQANVGFPNLALTDVCWTFALWLSTAYLCNSGGMKWKLPVGTGGGVDIWFAFPYENPGLLSPTTYFPKTAIYSNLSLPGTKGLCTERGAFNNFIEVDVPSRNRYKFRAGYTVYDPSTTATSTGECVAFTNPFGTSNGLLKIFNSGSDDFSIGGFLYAPIIVNLSTVL